LIFSVELLKETMNAKPAVVDELGLAWYKEDVTSFVVIQILL